MKLFDKFRRVEDGDNAVEDDRGEVWDKLNELEKTSDELSRRLYRVELHSGIFRRRPSGGSVGSHAN